VKNGRRERAMSGTIEVADAVRESFTGELIGPAQAAAGSPAARLGALEGQHT
jgi:hypothetical protein